MLMPTERSAARRVLEAWFEKLGITPTIVAEFDDSALIKTFGQQGVGVFIAPAAIEEAIVGQLGVMEIGRVPELRGRYYAISTERRIKHPAVAMITAAARNDLFSAAPSPRRPSRSAS